MATFNGINLFGNVTNTQPEPNPVDWQVNAYPSVPGYQTLYLGSRGGRTILTGQLNASSGALVLSQLIANQTIMLNGVVATFVNDSGFSYPQSSIQSFEKEGEIRPDDSVQGYTLRYKCVIEHRI